MISLENKSVELPYVFVQKLIQDSREKSALIILNPMTRNMRIIPTASENVIQIGVNLRSDPPIDILENLDQIYIEEKLKSIYSVPWVCYTQDSQNRFEEYVNLNLISSKDSLEDFKQKVERVDGVLNVELTPVPLSVPSSEKKDDKEWFESFIDRAKIILRRTQYQKEYLEILEIIYTNEHPTIEKISENFDTVYPLRKMKYFIGYLSKRKLVMTDNNTNTFYLSKKTMN